MLSADTDDTGDSGCYRNVRVSFTRNTVSYSSRALFHSFSHFLLLVSFRFTFCHYFLY